MTARLASRGRRRTAWLIGGTSFGAALLAACADAPSSDTPAKANPIELSTPALSKDARLATDTQTLAGRAVTLSNAVTDCSLSIASTYEGVDPSRYDLDLSPPCAFLRYAGDGPGAAQTLEKHAYAGGDVVLILGGLSTADNGEKSCAAAVRVLVVTEERDAVLLPSSRMAVCQGDGFDATRYWSLADPMAFAPDDKAFPKALADECAADADPDQCR